MKVHSLTRPRVMGRRCPVNGEVARLCIILKAWSRTIVPHSLHVNIHYVDSGIRRIPSATKGCLCLYLFSTPYLFSCNQEYLPQIFNTTFISVLVFVLKIYEIIAVGLEVTNKLSINKNGGCHEWGGKFLPLWGTLYDYLVFCGSPCCSSVC